MSTEDRAAAAISRLSGITTELNARRELRDRAAEAAKSSAKETMLKIGPMAEKVAERLGELGRRQRDAGGWATEKTLADKEPTFGFEPDEDEAPDGDLARFTGGAVVPENAEPDTIGVLAEDDEDHRPVQEPPAATAAPGVAVPGIRRRGRRRDEDDDFSNTPTWLKE